MSLPFRQDHAPTPHDALDRFYTPQRLADLIVDLLDVADPDVVVEPSVGGGAFARAIRRRWPRAHLIGVDVDPSAHGLTLCDEAIVGDWLSESSNMVADVIVGNPPFADAVDHVLASIAVRPAVAAFILPLSVYGAPVRWVRALATYPESWMRPIVGPRPWPANVRETGVFGWHRDWDGISRRLSAIGGER